MANLFVPVTVGSFAGQKAFSATNYDISDDYENIISSIRREDSPVYLLKQTGFTATKRKIAPTSGTSIMGQISITFVRDLTREMLQSLWNLAHALNGGGGLIAFRDAIMSDTTYTGKWINAGSFIESSTILGSGTMDIAYYTAVGI